LPPLYICIRFTPSVYSSFSIMHLFALSKRSLSLNNMCVHVYLLLLGSYNYILDLGNFLYQNSNSTKTPCRRSLLPYLGNFLYQNSNSTKTPCRRSLLPPRFVEQPPPLLVMCLIVVVGEIPLSNEAVRRYRRSPDRTGFPLWIDS
jgi:hypothetical protein